MIEILAFGAPPPLPPAPLPPRPRPQDHQETAEAYEAYCEALEAQYIKQLDAWEDARAKRIRSHGIFFATISTIWIGGFLAIAAFAVSKGLGWW